MGPRIRVDMAGTLHSKGIQARQYFWGAGKNLAEAIDNLALSRATVHPDDKFVPETVVITEGVPFFPYSLLPQNDAGHIP